MSRPPMYTKYPQFDERCTCGKPLAIHQRDFENVAKTCMEQGMSLNDSRIEAIKSLNIRKACCLRDLTHFAKNFIFDTTINAFSNITIVSIDSKKVKKGNVTTLLADTKKNKKNGSFMGVGAWEFLTPTNNKECFDQLK